MVISDSPAPYVVLRIPPDLTEEDLRASAVAHWVEFHRRRGYTVSPRRIAQLSDSRVARMARAHARHQFSNYLALIRGLPVREVEAVRARVDRLIAKCYPGLKPPEW